MDLPDPNDPIAGVPATGHNDLLPGVLWVLFGVVTDITENVIVNSPMPER